MNAHKALEWKHLGFFFCQCSYSFSLLLSTLPIVQSLISDLVATGSMSTSQRRPVRECFEADLEKFQLARFHLESFHYARAHKDSISKCSARSNRVFDMVRTLLFPFQPPRNVPSGKLPQKIS